MGRDTTTKRIVPDPTKFPNGISGLATQIHALGLKIGIYRYVHQDTSLVEIYSCYKTVTPEQRHALGFPAHWALRVLMLRLGANGALIT